MRDVTEAPEFDSHAADYEAQCMQGLEVTGEGKDYFAHGRLRYLRSWLESIGRAAPRTIVDYGCGVGDVTALLAEYFPAAQVIGLDPSSMCVERARRHHATDRVRFATTDAVAEAVTRPADLIHLSGVVHHVKPAQRSRLFAALAQLRAADGVVAVFENNPINPGTRIVMSRIPFDRDADPITSGALRRGLRDAGLQPCATRYLFYFPRMLRWLRPLEPLLTRVPLGAQYLVLSA